MPPVDVLVPGDTGEEGKMPAGDESLALSGRLHEHAMASLEQIGNRLMSDATTVSKAMDYDYQTYKNQISLASAMGAREIGSETNPGGPRKPAAA